jgi:hypothetical protein
MVLDMYFESCFYQLRGFLPQMFQTVDKVIKNIYVFATFSARNCAKPCCWRFVVFIWIYPIFKHIIHSFKEYSTLQMIQYWCNYDAIGAIMMQFKVYKKNQLLLFRKI